MSVNVASCGYHVVVDCVVQLVSNKVVVVFFISEMHFVNRVTSAV